MPYFSVGFLFLTGFGDELISSEAGSSQKTESSFTEAEGGELPLPISFDEDATLGAITGPVDGAGCGAGVCGDGVAISITSGTFSGRVGVKVGG